MKFNAIGWFEIPVTDLTRAKAFYEAVLLRPLHVIPAPGGEGVEMAVWDMDMEAPGSAGALVKTDTMKPSASPGLMIYFHSKDVNEELGRVAEAGGKVVMEKTGIGEHGFIGSFIDTEGNLVSVHSRA